MNVRARILSAFFSISAIGAPDFSKTVQPLLTQSCLGCHNDKMKSGGLSVADYKTAASITEHRDAWERMVLKMKTGEMPPKGIPRPPQFQVDAAIRFAQAEFEKADRNMKPDPGRVTARRLNRAEYNNTVRDLLGVEFRPADDFPADDSGYGFDNIGDVLTVSPVLMEKYLAAAERIASRAVAVDPLPKPMMAHFKTDNVQRKSPQVFEAKYSFPNDADYELRALFGGSRLDLRNKQVSWVVKGAMWLDDQLVTSFEMDPRPDRKRIFEGRVFVKEGPHTIRIAVTDNPDPFARDNPNDRQKAVIADGIQVLGPYKAPDYVPASRKMLFVCDPNTGDACVTRILSMVARRAYRRPVTALEVDGLVKFVRMAQADGQTVEQGIQLALTAVLVSPNFLFRIEKHSDPTNPELVQKISDLELASRLSYFLWSSMPDETLLSLAEKKRLRAPGVLEAQIKRMLADPKSSALAENFAGQWLELRNLDILKPDAKRFPDYTPELREAMKTETRLFFNTILKENRSISDFLDSRFTFLNETLAKHYGIDSITGDEFRRVRLASPQRGGVLTQASVLTVSSYPTRTSPVIRGKYLLENVLGAPPPPPPPNVPNLEEKAIGNTVSMRQQLEQHRSNAVCASCHSRMDVLGFGLENYDAIGRWRMVDGKFPIDPSGTFPNGKSFSSPAQMKALLKADLPEFSRCLIEKMLTYSLGRGMERYDKKTIESINHKLAANNYRFSDMITEVARSLPFQARRGEAVRGEAVKVSQR